MGEAKISKGLVAMAWPITDVHSLLDNPRRGDVEAVKRSLDRFGQYIPIVGRHTRDDGTQVNEILKGNHTLKGASELGWDHIAVNWETYSDLEAKAMAVADNHTSDLATNDDRLLADFLLQIQPDPGLLDATSYTADDIEDLLFLLQTPEVAGVSASEREGLYQAAGIRTIVLPFPVKDYDRVARWMDLLRAEYDRDTNSDAIYCALEARYADATPAADATE